MKLVKKMMALLLSVVMMLTMCTVVFADDANTKTLTIKTVAGHTYKVYQLLTGTAEKENGSWTLQNVAVGSSVNDTNITADNIIAALKDKSGAELGNAAYEYVNGGTAVQEILGSGVDMSVEVAQGYYVITDELATGGTGSISRYMVIIAGENQTVTPKTETPDIDKKIIDTDKNKTIDGDYKKTDTAAIGDTIEYEVTGKVPNYEGYKYYYYVLDDTLSKGLTLDENSFVVTVGRKTLTKGTDYYVYVTKNENGTTSFKLAFKNIEEYTVGDAISVRYNAEVNENAEIGTTPNTNTVKLIFSNNPNQSDRGDDGPDKPGIPSSTVPTGKTPDRVTKTYVTELKVIKVDGDGNKLTGAEFTLTGTNLTKIKFTTGASYVGAENGTFWRLKDGTYTTDDPNTDGIDQTKYEDVNKKYKTETVVTAETVSGENKSVIAFVDENGVIQFTGLDAGDYTLTETKTPKDYNTIEPIKFTIKAIQDGATTTEGGNIAWSSTNKDVNLNAGTFEITVKNFKGTVLPSTGGIGTTIFYIAGAILIIGAGTLLIVKKRRNS